MAMELNHNAHKQKSSDRIGQFANRIALEQTKRNRRSALLKGTVDFKQCYELWYGRCGAPITPIYRCSYFLNQNSSNYQLSLKPQMKPYIDTVERVND